MGLKAAVQALKKAEELKARVSRHDDLLNNSEVWSDQQQLQTVYHQVLVLDLEYALDKKVEQELWTLGFKNHIAALQHLSKDKKNPKRSEYQALLSWCLEAASGFYLTLLQELCTAFELDLPFRRRGSIYGQTKTSSFATVNLYNGTSEQPQKSSCLYICQYCLVHLGDIARYRSQRKQAESFYRHAILLSPSSGQPYNQLALLEASRGDKLATVFHYVRSISVKHPFPAAATNLANTLSAAIDHQEALTEVHTKLSIMEFLTMFLRVHGLLHLATDLDQAELYVKSLNATFTALVATHAFSSMKLIQMTAINLYALRHTLDSFSTEQLTTDELRVKNLILDLLAGAFSAYLLPIYTMPNDATLLDYYALPAIKLTLDWIKTDPDVLKEGVFTRRLQIWPSLCKLLNVLQTIDGECDGKNFDKIPLPEDRDLQCFLPLVNAYKDLDFTICVNPNYDTKFFNNLRANRLVNLSVWLSTQNIDNNVLITAKKLKNPNNVVFEPCIQQPDPTTELLNELKHFSVKDTVQKSPSKSLIEKRGGILKPQGSLEKAREEREQALILSTNIPSCVLEVNESKSSSRSANTDVITTKLKRNRQNVAMQALAKKVEENSKQVTFVTEPAIKNKVLEQPMNPFQNQMQLPPPQQQQQQQHHQQQQLHQQPPPPPPPPMSFKQNVPFQNTFPMPPSSFQNAVAPTYHQRPYQNFDYQSDQPFKTNWLHDDKLPMPPSTWTSWPHNNPKNNNIPQRPFPAPPPLNNERFHQNYPFNAPNTINTNTFIQDNIAPNYETPNNPNTNNPMYNNTMSLWNSGPNFQPNLQMIFNQQSKQNTSISKPAPPLFNEPVMPDRQPSNTAASSGGYSLFNSNWAPNLTVHSSLKYNNQNAPDRTAPPLMRQQSLFSGPGPSPLERLLQQQKQQRGGPNPNNTHKEDT